MAIYRTAAAQTYGLVPGVGQNRQMQVLLCCSVACTTAMIDNVNDEVELGWLPAGAVVTGIQLRASDMDTNGTPTLAFDVGDDTVESRLLVASVVGQAATRSDDIAVTGIGYKYAAKTRIKAYVQAVAATAAAGTLYCIITGFIDPNFTLANTVDGIVT